MRSTFYNRFILGLLISMLLSDAFAQSTAKMILPIAHFHGVSLISANSSESYLASADEKNRVVILDLNANREIDHVDFQDKIDKTNP